MGSVVTTQPMSCPQQWPCRGVSPGTSLSGLGYNTRKSNGTIYSGHRKVMTPQTIKQWAKWKSKDNFATKRYGTTLGSAPRTFNTTISWYEFDMSVRHEDRTWRKCGRTVILRIYNLMAALQSCNSINSINYELIWLLSISSNLSRILVVNPHSTKPKTHHALYYCGLLKTEQKLPFWDIRVRNAAESGNRQIMITSKSRLALEPGFLSQG